MKTLTKAILVIFAAGFATCVLSTPRAEAALINGKIDFAGSVMFDSSALQNVTQVVEWRDVFGNAGFSNVAAFNGSFVGFVNLGDQATMATPWAFLPPPGGQPALWSVGGFTFDLTSATVVMQTAEFLNISGVGTISGNGFEDTTARWAFTVQNAGGGTGDFFSFSGNVSTHGVPDGGSAVALLGIGLGVVEFIRRKLRLRT
jgi:VPDSG-CTERM motif